jgi:hypothetical protein
MPHKRKGPLGEWPFVRFLVGARGFEAATLLVRRCRRIAAVLLLRCAKELMLHVERIATNGVALTAVRAILQLVTWRADIEEPNTSVSELLCIARVFAAG